MTNVRTSEFLTAATVVAATRRGKSRRKGIDYATVRELALKLPGVVDSSTRRGISFRYRGRKR
jgi:hypothetical protein